MSRFCEPLRSSCRPHRRCSREGVRHGRMDDLSVPQEDMVRGFPGGFWEPGAGGIACGGGRHGGGWAGDASAWTGIVWVEGIGGGVARVVVAV